MAVCGHHPGAGVNSEKMDTFPFTHTWASRKASEYVGVIDVSRLDTNARGLEKWDHLAESEY